jgi:hypothetical protein
MFWMVMLSIAGLAGFAFGWISFQSTRDRLTISFEFEKARPVLEKVRHGAGQALAKGRQLFEHSRHS